MDDTSITWSRPASVDGAKRFRSHAIKSFNPDALPFHEGVNLGNRSSTYPHAMYWVGQESRKYNPATSQYTEQKNPFLPPNHQRYLNDAWWDLPLYGKEYNEHLFPTSAADVKPEQFAEYLNKLHSTMMPALKECALAGDVLAAQELERISGLATWHYDSHSFWNNSKSVSNPSFSKSQEDYWARVGKFLSGKGSSELLDSFLLSQRETSGGLYNIGVALYKNVAVREIYNAREGLDKNDLTPAEDFLKHAADMGNANAAWFLGNERHKKANFDKNEALFGEAQQWYGRAAEMGHPNAKHRAAYLQTQHALPTLADTSKEMLEPSKSYMAKYPQAIQNFDIPKVDYSFMTDASQGDMLTRVRKAVDLSDAQVKSFETVVRNLEQKIDAALRESSIQLERIKQNELDRLHKLDENTRDLQHIAEHERSAQLSTDRWIRETGIQTASMIGLAILTGGASLGMTGHNVTGTIQRSLGYGAVAQNEVEYRGDLIANLRVKLHNIGMHDTGKEGLLKEIERIAAMKSITDLRKDEASVTRLIQGYLRQQVLETAKQNIEYVDKYAKRAGLASVDALVAVFDEKAKQGQDDKRICHAVRNFCFGYADTADLHVLLAYADHVGTQPQESLIPADKALHQLSERLIKPSILDYASKSSRMDVLRSSQYNLLRQPDSDAALTPPERHTPEIMALIHSNFASEGSLEVNRMFDFYLHRHGDAFLRPTRLNDGMANDNSERKRVHLWTPAETDEFIDRTIHSYRNDRIELPNVDSIFLRVCAAEYFAPQAVATSGAKGSFRDNPQAPVAYPMVNQVIQDFTEKMALSPFGKYRQTMENKADVDALIAQSFIDFFAVLGQLHDKEFATERSELERAYNLKHYGTRFRDCCNAISDSAVEQYDLFRDIFAKNLQKTLEVKPLADGSALLEHLKAIQEMGSHGLLPENILIPGSEEALQNALHKNRRYENMNIFGGRARF